MAENRVTQVGVEVLHNGNANARVSQTGVEVLHNGAASARVTQVGIEVLRSVTEEFTTEIKMNTVDIESGSGNVTVPNFVSFLRIEVWGGGGGSPSVEQNFAEGPGGVSTVIRAGGDGGDSSIVIDSSTTLLGEGGQGSARVTTYHPSPLFGFSGSGTLYGLGGAASGGTTNTTGENGAAAVLQYASPPSYSTGWVTGQGLTYFQDVEGKAGRGGGMTVETFFRSANLTTAGLKTSTAGIRPGRGANGSITFSSTGGGTGTSGGGEGGYSMVEFAASDTGAPSPGDLLAYVVGAAGAAGVLSGGNANRIQGAAGAPGRVRLTYDTYYSTTSAEESDADPSAWEPMSSDDPESFESESDVDLFPGVTRPPVPPFADFDSMWSVGNRYGTGLVVSAGAVGTESTLNSLTTAFNANYGAGAGDGPADVIPGPTTDPTSVYYHFTLSQGQWLRGMRLVNGDTDVPGYWSVWAGLVSSGGHAGPMIPLSDSYVGACVSNGLETERHVFGVVPEPAYDIPFDYFEIRLDSWGGSDDLTRICAELELLIAHSNLDGGDRTGDVANGADPEKRMFITSNIPLNAGVSEYDGTWKGLLAGWHWTTNRTGALTADQAVATNASFGAGFHITFHFPREVGMREMLFETRDGEVYDSAGDPTLMGTWQWSGSNDGTSWTNVGGVLKFSEDSHFNILPSPQDDASDAPSSDEWIRYRFWRMTSVTGFSAARHLWGVTFNLIDHEFGHTVSDIEGGSGDSDESDFTSSDDPSDVDSSDSGSSGGSSSGDSSDSGGGSGSASDSSGSPSASDSESDSVAPSYEPSDFPSDSFGDHDPATLPIVQTGVMGLV
jgi:hypothetical protein